jgi:predicted ATPase
MVTSLFVRHFKIYKDISFIPLSEGCVFSSIIGEKGVGKTLFLSTLLSFIEDVFDLNVAKEN